MNINPINNMSFKARVELQNVQTCKKALEEIAASVQNSSKNYKESILNIAENNNNIDFFVTYNKRDFEAYNPFKISVPIEAFKTILLEKGQDDIWRAATKFLKSMSHLNIQASRYFEMIDNLAGKFPDADKGATVYKEMINNTKEALNLEFISENKPLVFNEFIINK